MKQAKRFVIKQYFDLVDYNNKVYVVSSGYVWLHKYKTIRSTKSTSFKKQCNQLAIHRYIDSAHLKWRKHYRDRNYYFFCNRLQKRFDTNFVLRGYNHKCKWEQ